MENCLPPSVGAAVWQFVNGALADQPWRVGKPLRGELEGLWSARRGEYRVIYRVVGETVQIMRVGHRADVYRPR
ncbi:MAG: type II toxin-antitoxin system RelE/ParE family toxin [Propionibacteriaceae bacterium]|nr:type II toxin-antitoxin system RelE/ParE family toxin [Propionibacteriaceae bacterium]